MKKSQLLLLDAMMHTCMDKTATGKNKIHIENEFKSLIMMLFWLDEMKHSGEMNTEQARIHIDIQKTTMRTRLMSLPGISVIEAEHIINDAIDSIRKEIYDHLDWIII